MRGSASKTALLMACGAWAKPEAQWETSTSAAAEHGTREHSFEESVIERRFLSSDVYTASRKLVVDWIVAHARAFTLAEIPFALDVERDTARQLDKTKGHRAYEAMGALPHEFCGTADAVTYLRDEDAVEVWDWIHGREWEYKIPQQRTLCLMAARAFGASRARYKIIQVLPDSVAVVGADDLDEFALAAVSGDLGGRLAEIPTAKPQPGSHCSALYCPHRAYCPATLGAVADVVPADALARHTMSAEIATLEQAAYVLPRLRLLENFIKAAKDSLRAIARREGGIPTGSGTIWRECTRNAARFDRAAAIALLGELGASEEQINALTSKVQETYFDERKTGV